MKKLAKVGMSLIMATLFSGCQYFPFQKTDGEFRYHVENGEGMVLINVEKVEGNVYLFAVMKDAKEKEFLDFECNAGMLTHLNGVENAPDWSSSWMLYTTDEEMGNETWGVYEYEGEIFKSAILGMEQLPVAEGESYIWVYQSFEY